MLEDIGRIVRFHRKQARLTQKTLADQAGVGKTVVFDIETGKRTIKLETILRVLHVLNIRIKCESPLMGRYMETFDAKS
jgi:y4mF family transcriptional regulator